MTDLVVYERALQPHIPQWRELLAPIGLPAERLAQTVLISLERGGRALREASMESIVLSATSFAVLGLEVDGVSGQGFLIPFKGRAQPVIGYKGYNTLGHRAGFTLSSGVVREGDEFDFSDGTKKFVHHKRKQRDLEAAITHAWAVAMATGREPFIAVLFREELDAARSRSPGARMADSPWNDPKVGYPAMCAKTAKRRLARDMPMGSFQRAAALETQFEELGKPAYLRPDGAMIDLAPEPEPAGEVRDLVAGPKVYRLTMFAGGGTREREFTDLREWAGVWDQIVEKFQGRPDILARYRDANAAHFAAIGDEAIAVAGMLEQMTR